MTTGKKIAIVFGDFAHPRWLAAFIPLTTQHHVTVFSLLAAREFEEFSTYFQIESFRSTPDLPGFMRGFEKKSENIDIFIVFDSTRISSFQALLVAKKYKKKYWVYSTETQIKLYDNFSHVLSMQKEIIEFSTQFFAPQAQAQNYLEHFGAPKSKIQLLSPMVSPRGLKLSLSGRKKFRDGLQVSESCFLLIYHQSLDECDHPEFILQVMNSIKKAQDQGKSVKIIFAGQGDQEKNLKYMAYDLGLGSSIFFLHQDCQAFLQDFYSAGDAIIYTRSTRESPSIYEPYKMLEAMICGLTPFVPINSVQSQLFSQNESTLKRYDENDPATLVEGIFELVQNGQTYLRKKEVISCVMDNYCKFDKTLEIFSRAIHEEEDPLQQAIIQDHYLNFIQSLKTQNKENINNMIDRFIPQHPELKSHEKSLLYSIQGEALHSLGRFDMALKAFERSLFCDEQNHEAFSGLGYLSLSSHSYEDAVTFFKRALALSSTAKVSLGIGTGYRKLGILSVALFWFEKATIEEDGSSLSLMTLLQTCRESKDWQLSIHTLERVKTYLGEHPGLQNCLDELYFKVEGSLSKE